MSAQEIIKGYFSYKDENQYRAFLTIFTDAKVFPTTYAAWRHQADKIVEDGRKRGITWVNVYEESAEKFALWCRVNEVEVGGAGRKLFVEQWEALNLESQE